MDIVLFALMTKRGINNIQQVTDIYERLVDFEKNKSFYRSLEPEINEYRKKLLSKDDYKWRYNVNEMRFYTYEELKARRENYMYPRQMLGIKGPTNFKNLKEYNL